MSLERTIDSRYGEADVNGREGPMKRMTMVGGLLFLVLLLALPAHAVKGKGGGGGGGKSGTMSVQMRTTTVRSTPMALGPAVGTISYGQEVTVVGEQGNWYQIDRPAGWVPKTDLTKHKVAVNPDQKFSGSGAKRDEVALAGKGFNPQVEAAYRRDNPALASAYAAVDRIEGFDASEAALKAFAASGKLKAR